LFSVQAFETHPLLINCWWNDEHLGFTNCAEAGNEIMLLLLNLILFHQLK